MDIDEIPGFFLFVKFVFLFHLVDVDVIMVTNIIISVSASLKFNFTFFNAENNNFLEANVIFLCVS